MISDKLNTAKCVLFLFRILCFASACLVCSLVSMARRYCGVMRDLVPSKINGAHFFKTVAENFLFNLYLATFQR